jgi:predicted O-methyltransferase YrrM
MHVESDEPARVSEARRWAHDLGFQNSSTPDVGRLLRVLAGGITRGTIVEIGTGTGEGAAWIADGLQPGVRFVTVELDPVRARVACDLFAGVAGVAVVAGDWHQLVSRSPFAMLFADGGKAKVLEPDTLIDAVAPGGLIVLDDLTPEELWPEEWRGRPDPLRDFWLHDARLLSVEVRVSPRESVILATKRG